MQMADGPDPRSIEEIQDTLASAVRAYVQALESGADAPPFRPEHEVTMTESAALASQVLRCAGIEIFELVLWESWNTRA